MLLHHFLAAGGCALPDRSSVLAIEVVDLVSSQVTGHEPCCFFFGPGKRSSPMIDYGKGRQTGREGVFQLQAVLACYLDGVCAGLMVALIVRNSYCDDWVNMVL